MADETMVEKMARVLVKARGLDPDEPTGFVTSGVPGHRVLRWEAARGEAAVFIAAYESHLKDSGMVIVPVEPTEAMVSAAMLADSSDHGTEPGLIETHYRAMLKSFLPTQEQEGIIYMTKHSPGGYAAPVITPEMLAAGVRVFGRHDPTGDLDSETVREIFLEMLRHCPRSSRTSQGARQ